MSLIEVYTDSVWVDEAIHCQPEDIVDLADQLKIVRETRETIANRIQSKITPVVFKRLMDGDVNPQLAELYFKTIPGYTEVN